MALPRFLPHSSSCLLSPLHNPRPLSLLNAACGRRIIDGASDRFRIRGSLAPPESAVADFWQWMSKKGAVSASSAVVKPGFVPEGLGLVSQRDIPRNEVVVEIPKSIWIDADTVAASEIGRLCGGLRPWVAIALFLLREKALGQASPWHPYLNILPTTTNSTLFCAGQKRSSLRYKVRELCFSSYIVITGNPLTLRSILLSASASCIKVMCVCICVHGAGTQLLSTTIGAKEYVESEFTKVEAEILLPNKDLFPSAIMLPDFLWAFGLLRSRAFSRLRGENLALVPLADLINHSSNITVEESSWEIKGKGLFSRELIFSLRTPAYIKSGEQVYIQYDMGKSNADLALDYGFVDPRPDRDAYTLTLDISESDPFYGDKLDIAESNGLAETAYFDVVKGHTLPPLMLPYLRLVALGGTDAFLLESIFRNSVWDHLELPVSRANEETICRVVRDACKSALSGYGTTIEEDEKLMERGNLGERLGIAVRIRVGEKKLLRQIDDAFRDRESELDGLEYYQERRLKDLGLVGEQGEIIFWETK